MNGKAICAYSNNPENKASLRTYLCGILYHKVIDANRQKKVPTVDPAKLEIENIIDPQGTPEQELERIDSEALSMEIRRLTHQALLCLAKESPRDAEFMRMRLEGLTYEQMAIRLEDKEKCTTREIKKKTNAIKKQFTREYSGTTSKFKVILESLLKERGLSLDIY
jgi:DNA-directed RNA polymerase specialized sigma24 family protein